MRKWRTYKAGIETVYEIENIGKIGPRSFSVLNHNPICKIY